MKGLTWLWLNVWFLNIIIVIFQNKAFYSSHVWTWRALRCHSVWYFHHTRMHLNICAILFGMCDREMTQQVPHLSQCATYHTLTSSTGSSNDCTWAGKPPLGRAALNISQQHRTHTAQHRVSCIPAKSVSADQLLILHQGWQQYDWYCLLTSQQAFKHCLVFGVSLTRGALPVSYLSHVLIISLFNGVLFLRSPVHLTYFFLIL